MIIKKFQGATETEAITKAKNELGKDAVVMNVKTIKPRGIMKLFKPVQVEVTAALEENNNQKNIANVNYDNDKKEDAEFDKSKEGQQGSIYAPFEVKKSELTMSDNKDLEAKLESLSALLQKQITTSDSEKNKAAKPEDNSLELQPKKDKNPNMAFIKMIYNTLIDNEVDERNVNQIMSEIDSVMRNDMQIDTILSSLYQKLILKFGKPEPIALENDKPNVVFFIGPTGVGKTTTVAKLASIYKLEKKKKVAFFTADTYRIAAADQLKIYADIIDAPLSVIYSPEDLSKALEENKDCDLILVDTAGYSHKNTDQQEEIKKLIETVGEDYSKQIYLVLSATTKYADLRSIVDAYNKVCIYNMSFNKLEEKAAYGNLVNVRMYSGANISYTTNGQNVPDDLENFDSQRIVKLLLGGKA